MENSGLNLIKITQNFAHATTIVDLVIDVRLAPASSFPETQTRDASILLSRRCHIDKSRVFPANQFWKRHRDARNPSNEWHVQKHATHRSSSETMSKPPECSCQPYRPVQIKTVSANCLQKTGVSRNFVGDFRQILARVAHF